MAQLTDVPVGDGARYVAYPLGLTTKIIDARTRRTQSVTTPANCSPPDAVGGGMVLLHCDGAPGQPYGDPRPLLYDIHARRFVTPAGIDSLVTEYRAHYSGLWFAGVGSQWIQIHETDNHVDTLRYLNWHTGALAYDPADAGVVADLDSPSLTRRLCAPLQRPPDPDGSVVSQGPFYPLGYDRPLAFTGGTAGTLIALTCGTRRTRELSKCFAGCDPSLGSGLLSWIDDHGRYALLPSDSRHSTRLPLPQGAGRRALHTTTTLYAIGPGLSLIAAPRPRAR